MDKTKVMKDGKVKNEKVIFRMFGDGQVIAFFPEIATDTLGYNCQSYMHVGQHGAASPSLVASTKPAKEEDYQHLFKELTALGYDLKVVKCFSYPMQKVRMAMYS
jgi:hypothetical protein